MMLGYILARAGIAVTVLEKHADFLRDFRGDTIHPSTMTVMDELGLLEDFLKRPHQKVTRAQGEIGGVRVQMADFSHLPCKTPFVAFMPQWDFLDFLAEKARALPSFTLMMECEATGQLREGEKIVGCSVQTRDGRKEIRASLTIGADGRQSVLREASGLTVHDLGAPIDALWFKLSLRPGDSTAVLGRIAEGQIMVMLHRGDYWQCAVIIPKGGLDALKAEGLEAFRARVAALAGRTDAQEIGSWDDVKLLTVKVDRLERWHLPGLLFIGDAAHAMSPVGGVGINLAIQDAVAAANILAGPLRAGTLRESDLARVQKRRMLPTRATQAFQVFAQNNVLGAILGSRATPELPAIVKLLQRWPVLQRIPARAIGFGLRPEHVRMNLLR
jgi:2-polyprenyl-6-methoxyphenol hydroxylase-like FAD-dependent oxidoreductase